MTEMRFSRLRALVTGACLALVTIAASILWGREASSQDESELLGKTDEIAARVAELRGLALEKPIRRGVMGKAEIRERLLERVDQEYSPEEIAGEALSLKRMGLLEPDADYLDLVMQVLTDQIAGFYDPWEGELYIADWSVVGGEMLMAHEIDHALQDQHFDLRAFMKVDKSNADATVARQALVEGDGTALMLEYSMGDGSSPWAKEGFTESFQTSLAMSTLAMREVPLAIREGLIFPYSGGLGFVGHFRKRHPWSRIDALYARPPLSTEHILHPEKYEAYEVPVSIRGSVPASLPEYVLAYDNVIGEKSFELFLRQHGVADERALSAAAGWGGDRMVIAVPPDHEGDVTGSVAVVHSRWDDESEAIELFEALTRGLPSLAGRRGVRRNDGVIEHRLPDGSAVAAERRGDAVLLVVGSPPARLDDILADAAAWPVAR